jgi:WD40 repeat protein
VAKSDFFITASVDGHVKFWKKMPEGIEFVKHFWAHTAPVDCMSVSYDGSLLATVSRDGTAKVFDIVTFDMVLMLKLDFVPSVCEWMYRVNEAKVILRATPAPAWHHGGAGADRREAGARTVLLNGLVARLSRGLRVGSACWWSEAEAARVALGASIAHWQVKLAIADKAEGKVHIFDTKTGDNTPIHTLSTGKPTLHMRFNYKYETLVTTDAAGMISYWSSTEFKHPSQVVSFKHKVRTRPPRPRPRLSPAARGSSFPFASPRLEPQPGHIARGSARRHTQQATLSLSLSEKYL